MISVGLKKDLNQVLSLIAQKLDLDVARYQKAAAEYEAIASWLNEENSMLAQYSPQIYPQGSFTLGTAVRPINPDEDFDIDLVCELSSVIDGTSPGQVKKIVGDRLNQNNRYRQNLQEKNRCWRINFPGDFHMDVLPSMPDEERGGTVILVPDKELSEWTQSDPKGYAAWFRDRMRQQYSLNRIVIAKNRNKDVEEIPDYEVKTALQQAIQLLKRDRDIRFVDEPNRKPISIIITTLSGHSYRNQDDLFDTLKSIVEEMPNHIQDLDGVPWVTNPVNHDENFADKWEEHPERKDAFYEWIDNLKRQLTAIDEAASLQDIETILHQLFGEQIASGAIKEVSGLSAKPIATSTGSKFDVPHKLPLKWEYRKQYRVNVTAIKKAGKTIKGVMPKSYPNNGHPIAKWYSLEFTATTDVPHQYTVEWQVVNTGEEAEKANGLRGGFEFSSGSQKNKFYRKESTLYRGRHWIEAFVIKNGVCVARSGEFIVNIQ